MAAEGHVAIAQLAQIAPLQVRLVSPVLGWAHISSIFVFPPPLPPPLLGQCVCVPNCTAAGSCGNSDGCGGTCPCTQQGECFRNCSNSRECDGCGHTCGDRQTCSTLLSMQCSSDGKCVCIPDCGDRDCGPDGCGGSCGTCTEYGATCHEETGQCYCEDICADQVRA